MGKKRGVLSMEERNYIERNVHDMTVQEIADNLDRTTTPIQKYIDENTLLVKDKVYSDELELLKDKLRNRYYYEQISQNYTANELKYFENAWADIMFNLKEDVESTEESQLLDHIDTRIRLNRNARAIKALMEEQEELDKIFAGMQGGGKTDEDFKVLMDLNERKSQIGQTFSAYSKEHKELSMIAANTEKSLKVQRNQRLEKIENSKDSWAGLLKRLQEDKFRTRVGIEAEIMARETDLARLELSKPHQYEDQSYDLPLLNKESVEKLENESTIEK